MQKKRTALFLILASVLLSCFVVPASSRAAEDSPASKETLQASEENLDLEENSSEALEMIALRMKSLSSSLNEMPQIPQLNQTIQLPLQDSEEKENQDLESIPHPASPLLGERSKVRG